MFSRRFIALLLLLGWLNALAHVAFEHSGATDQATTHASLLCGSAHCSQPHLPPDEGRHRHDLSGLTGERLDLLKEPAPVEGRLLSGVLREIFAALERKAAQPSAGKEQAGRIEDARTQGFLFVCFTARPVRGPSLI